MFSAFNYADAIKVLAFGKKTEREMENEVLDSGVPGRFRYIVREENVKRVKVLFRGVDVWDSFVHPGENNANAPRPFPPPPPPGLATSRTLHFFNARQLILPLF